MNGARHAALNVLNLVNLGCRVREKLCSVELVELIVIFLLQIRQRLIACTPRSESSESTSSWRLPRQLGR